MDWLGPAIWRAFVRVDIRLLAGFGCASFHFGRLEQGGPRIDERLCPSL